MWAVNQYLKATSQGRVEKAAPFLPAFFESNTMCSLQTGRILDVLTGCCTWNTFYVLRLLMPTIMNKPDILGHINTVLCTAQSPLQALLPAKLEAQRCSPRKEVECSYIINNVVIPMSKAAATRVEKPRYKEIVVPRSSNKADGRWAGQPQPASPVAGFNCLNDLYMCSSTGAHSPETCNGLQSLSVRGRTRTVLSCSEDTRSAPETLDEAMQSVQPWAPRTFPLSDSAYHSLLQCSNEDGCKQADVQPCSLAVSRASGLPL
ncbi:KAT8 regulatory NSL complex subunit 1-like [Opisthocomus hoazin]|uniref:KAT8 regulatory NSL complex subunit 1-like n=1 Tax=Opisthocomus hoazin TaxID=30419 RepID=UPI003F53125B